MVKTKKVKYADLNINYFESRKASLAIRTVGEGPPLIFVHGWPLHGYSWRYIIDDLSKIFTCYIVDMPGLGNSKWNKNADLNWNTQAKRLIDLIRHYKLKNFSFIAHNSGASISRIVAMELDSSLKKEFKNLILINTEMPNHRPPYIPFYKFAAKLPFAKSSFKLLLKSKTYIKSKFGFGGFFHDKTLLDNPEYFTDPYVNPCLKDPKRLEGSLQYLIGCDMQITDTFVTRHKEIEAKILLIWGENCPVFPIEIAEKMVGQFNNAVFERIPDCNFLPHEEKPNLVLSAVFKFLKN